MLLAAARVLGPLSTNVHTLGQRSIHSVGTRNQPKPFSYSGGISTCGLSKPKFIGPRRHRHWIRSRYCMQPPLPSSSQSSLTNALQSGSGSGMRYNTMLQQQLQQQNSMQAHDSRYEYTNYQNLVLANQNLMQQQQLQQAKKINSDQLAQRSLQAEERIYALILDLMNPNLREQALLELSKKREMYDDLAIILWHSYGVVSILLQEIISVYPLLSPPALTAVASNRVCNALALLQCIASHSATRPLLLNAHIPLFLYPFLNTTSKTRAFEYLRLTSLGVIGAFVKNDNAEVINFLLSTEIIPLCLRTMENGSELSRTVAIFIVQKILMDDAGLVYICQTYERFYAVTTVLNDMVSQLAETQSIRLLKHVIRCYLRLSENPRAREALRQCLPDELRDATFAGILRDDITSQRYLNQLLINLLGN